MPLTISVAELEEALALGADLVMIDVRSPDEYLRESIPGSKNIPLTELTDAFSDLDDEATKVFICQSGMRSLKAVGFAQTIGLKNSKSLEGGLNAWNKDDWL